jgi:threonyl-tRNA synthetase
LAQNLVTHTSATLLHLIRFRPGAGAGSANPRIDMNYKDVTKRIPELQAAAKKVQSGELSGLRRLRAFTMPDVHALVSNLDMAMDEFKVRFDLSLSVLKNISIENDDIEMALRTTKDFYEKK